MAFNMSYSFEGNYRSKPEQNLSGSSKKQTRDVLIQRAHEERKKRQVERMRLHSTLVLQSYVRSYLTRKQKKQNERLAYDQGDFDDIKKQMGRFLFFYYSNVDRERFVHIGHILLMRKENILHSLGLDITLNWLIKRFLVICLHSILDSYEDSRKLAVVCLKEFLQPNSLAYLSTKGYFKYLKNCLERVDDVEEHIILNLIMQCFQFYSLLGESKNSVLSEFSNNFLLPVITPKVKNVIIPSLNDCNYFPYNDLILFLNSSRTYNINMSNLLYCVLALEPPKFEQTKQAIQVLSKLSTNLYNLTSSFIDLSEDSDIEDMEVSDEQVLLQDYVVLLNNPDRVKRILHYFDEHRDDEEVLDALAYLCHNLLLVYKDSIKKFMLVSHNV